MKNSRESRINRWLMEIIDQRTYSFVPVVRLSDHMLSQAAHIVCILGEIFGQTCFMASRRQQINVLISLCQSKERLSKFLIREFYIVSSFHVLIKSYLDLCCHTSYWISFFQIELL